MSEIAPGLQERVRNAGRLAAYEAFVMFLNPKFRGPSFSWEKLPDLAEAKAEEVLVKDLDLQRKHLEQTIRAAQEQIKDVERTRLTVLQNAAPLLEEAHQRAERLGGVVVAGFRGFSPEYTGKKTVAVGVLVGSGVRRTLHLDGRGVEVTQTDDGWYCRNPGRPNLAQTYFWVHVYEVE